MEDPLAAAVAKARAACACLSCEGLRPLGGHTIANQDDPRPTPTSCLAGEVLAFLLAGVEVVT